MSFSSCVREDCDQMRRAPAITNTTLRRIHLFILFTAALGLAFTAAHGCNSGLSRTMEAIEACREHVLPGGIRLDLNQLQRRSRHRGPGLKSQFPPADIVPCAQLITHV